MLVFEEGVKPENLEKNLSKQRTTNNKRNPYIVLILGIKPPALSLLGHPCSPNYSLLEIKKTIMIIMINKIIIIICSV